MNLFRKKKLRDKQIHGLLMVRSCMEVQSEHFRGRLQWLKERDSDPVAIAEAAACVRVMEYWLERVRKACDGQWE